MYFFPISVFSFVIDHITLERKVKYNVDVLQIIKIHIKYQRGTILIYLGQVYLVQQYPSMLAVNYPYLRSPQSVLEDLEALVKINSNHYCDCL